jgi:hypothetical protein
MKKTLTLIAAATLSALSFASWADTLTVGASNTPHAEILEQAKPILAKQGIDLEIKPFQDYILRPACNYNSDALLYLNHSREYRMVDVDKAVRKALAAGKTEISWYIGGDR